MNAAKGLNDFYDAHAAKLERELLNADNLEFRARRIVEKTALALQASILLRHAPDFVAEAFCAARLSENNSTFGTLPVGTAVEKIIERNQWIIDNG